MAKYHLSFSIPDCDYHAIKKLLLTEKFKDYTEPQLISHLIEEGLEVSGIPADPSTSSPMNYDDLPPGCDPECIGVVDDSHVPLHVMHSVVNFAHRHGFFIPSDLMRNYQERYGADLTRALLMAFCIHSIKYSENLLEALLDHELQNREPFEAHPDSKRTLDFHSNGHN